MNCLLKYFYCEPPGTLDGFSFDSDEEADKTNVEADQQEAAEEQPADGKTKKKQKSVCLLFYIYNIYIIIFGYIVKIYFVGV